MMTMQPTSAGSTAHVFTVPDEAHGPTRPSPRELGTLPLSRLRRVTGYIQEHLDQELTLAQLGAVVYMSPYYFARLFQHSTGLPPHRFVVRSRIDRATGLLADPDLPIARISRAVGFGTPSHFSTVFRRIMGVTPRAYRAERLRRRWAAREGGRDDVR